MENASKALLIAGGILLAILILSLLVYMASSTSRMAEAQDKKVAAEQLQEFNSGYEAYNKTRMYGTDIITVANKAVEYNSKIDSKEKQYLIDIVLILKEEFATTTQVITEKGDGSTVTGSVIKQGNVSLSAGEHHLLVKPENTMDSKIINFFNQKTSDDVSIDKSSSKEIRKTYTYSALSNFKRAIFKCTNVHYSDLTGRVDIMEFTQI